MSDPIRAILDRLDAARMAAYLVGDTERTREAVYVGAVFARFAALDSVSRAERATVDFYVTGALPAYLATQRRKCLQSLTARYSDTTLFELMANTPHPREQLADVCHIYGFGPIKAAFALAVSGLGREACLDVHICRLRGIEYSKVTRLASRKPINAAGAYIGMCQRIYIGESDRRYAQWRDYAALVPAFRESLHMPVMELVLGAYAGQVAFPKEAL